MREATPNPGTLLRVMTLGCLLPLAAMGQGRTSTTVLGVRLEPYCRVAVLESVVTATNADRTEVRGETRFHYWMRTSATGGEGSLEMVLAAAGLPAGVQLRSQTRLEGVGAGLETGPAEAGSSQGVARFGQRTTTPANGQQGRTEWVLSSPDGLPISLTPPLFRSTCR